MPPSTQSGTASGHCKTDSTDRGWATRTRAKGGCAQALKPAEPCSREKGEKIIPCGGGRRLSNPHLAGGLHAMAGNLIESVRRNPDWTVPGCASNLDRCIAQACNCDRRGRIRVSEVMPVPVPTEDRWLKLETFIEVREVLWNLDPLKPHWVRRKRHFMNARRWLADRPREITREGLRRVDTGWYRRNAMAGSDVSRPKNPVCGSTEAAGEA